MRLHSSHTAQPIQFQPRRHMKKTYWQTLWQEKEAIFTLGGVIAILLICSELLAHVR